MKVSDPQSFPMIPLRGVVVFPEASQHFDVQRRRSKAALDAAMKEDQQIFLVAQRDMDTENPEPEDMYRVGVVAEIQQILQAPDGISRVMVHGLYRARVMETSQDGDYSVCTVVELPDRRNRKEDAEYLQAQTGVLLKLFSEYAAVSEQIPRDSVQNLIQMEDPVRISYNIISMLPMPFDRAQVVLETLELSMRLDMLMVVLNAERNVAELQKDIYGQVHEAMDKNQRDYFLREQLRVISEELGEGENVLAESAEYQQKLDRLEIPDKTRAHVAREISKLRKMPPMSPESSVIRSYLDWIFDLPWNNGTKEKLDVDRAEKILNKDHYGLEKVKERILDLLAVRQLSPELPAQIICLVGPPGTGKTSVARSIARATGRKYIRASLGGVRDEADIRGHRRTYVGSMPGRIITGIKEAGVRNPLFLLDEVDKLGNDFRGDPASALLEVLDPEQNSTFVDHYIEVPFDLSQVLFIATANTTETIPSALLDRMEVIELSSYTREEKFQIAKHYLVPKQLKNAGLSSKTLRIRDNALYGLIDWYTREAGVRKLERSVAALCRKAARRLVAGEEKVVLSADDLIPLMGPHLFRPEEAGEKSEVGVVTGLAWTQVGGETMPIEVAVLPGTGKLELTGSLGDVMKESAHAAYTCIRSRAEALGIQPDFYKDKDIHIHVPEGAVPKDGPSAGITMATALASALSGRAIRSDLAMTGEITLRGRVLAIGGLREKTMAAYRAGIRTVVIPEENLPNLEEVDRVVKDAITFVPAKMLEDVLAVALPEEKK